MIDIANITLVTHPLTFSPSTVARALTTGLFVPLEVTDASVES